MNGELKQRVLRNVAWLAGVLLVSAVAIGGALYRLRSRQVEVTSLTNEIQGVRDHLASGAPAAERARRVEAAEAELAEWREMTGSESLRIQALTAAARTAGVTLTSLKGADAVDADEGLLERSHRVRGVGDYRQIAIFLDAIQETRGMAAVDELSLRRDEDERPGALHASLRVTWHAAGDRPPAEVPQ